MEEFELLRFFMWSAITGIVMAVTGFSYRVYVRKNNSKISLS